MSGNEHRNDATGSADGGSVDGSARRAVVRTTHAEADLVAAALAPDETESMTTRIDGDTIECAVGRPTTGGLRSTVDDYVVNLHVADRIVERARAYRARTDDGGHTSDTNTDTNINT